MSEESNKNEWVSLREAAKILGVHPATVRNWADRGDLPTRRTPGGHRRFRRGDLEQWVETSQSPPPAEISMLVQNTLGKMRMQIGDGDMGRLGMDVTMDDSARQLMREKGRSLLDVLQNYLSDPDDVAPHIAQVQALGQDYACFLKEKGLPLSQAMEGFLFFIDFLHEASLNIVEVVNSRDPGDWLELLRQVRRFNNTLLLALTQAYEQIPDVGEDAPSDEQQP